MNEALPDNCAKRMMALLGHTEDVEQFQKAALSFVDDALAVRDPLKPLILAEYCRKWHQWGASVQLFLHILTHCDPALGDDPDYLTKLNDYLGRIHYDNLAIRTGGDLFLYCFKRLMESLVHRHRRMIHPIRLQKFENIRKFPIFVNAPNESVH